MRTVSILIFVTDIVNNETWYFSYDPNPRKLEHLNMLVIGQLQPSSLNPK